MPPNPLATARIFAARDMYTKNPKKFQVGPPLKNPAYAPANCTILKKFSGGGGGHAPEPPSKVHDSKSENNSCPPPLPHAGYRG